MEKASTEPYDLLADFRTESGTVSSPSGTNLLSFDDVKSETESGAAGTASDVKLEGTKPLDLCTPTLESDRKEDESKSFAVLEPVADSLEPEAVRENSEDEMFVEAVETLNRGEEGADVTVVVDMPVQEPVLNILQGGNDVMAPNLEPLVVGAAHDLVVGDTLQHTADVETVSANQDAALNLSSNQDAVLNDQGAVLNLSTNQDAVLNLSTNQDAVLNISSDRDAVNVSSDHDNVSTNQDAVLTMTTDQNAVLNVVTNQDEAVLTIATNQETVETMPSAPALLDLSETVQLVCREEAGPDTEGPLYPRLDSVIEGIHIIFVFLSSLPYCTCIPPPPPPPPHPRTNTHNPHNCSLH